MKDVEIVEIFRKKVERRWQKITEKRWKSWKKLKGFQVKEMKEDETRWNIQT